jgi:hypothetical protein
MGALFGILRTAFSWILPSAIGWVAADVVNTKEKSTTSNDMASIAQAAGQAAKTNWLKWVAYMVIGIALAATSIFIFKIKRK